MAARDAAIVASLPVIAMHVCAVRSRTTTKCCVWVSQSDVSKESGIVRT
jgi:3-dehydroquinate dehydratase